MEQLSRALVKKNISFFLVKKDGVSLAGYY